MCEGVDSGKVKFSKRGPDCWIIAVPCISMVISFEGLALLGQTFLYELVERYSHVRETVLIWH